MSGTTNYFLVDNVDEVLGDLTVWTPQAQARDGILHQPSICANKGDGKRRYEVDFSTQLELEALSTNLFDADENEEDEEELTSICNSDNVNFDSLGSIISNFTSQVMDQYSNSQEQGIDARDSFETLLGSVVPVEMTHLQEQHRIIKRRKVEASERNIGFNIDNDLSFNLSNNDDQVDPYDDSTYNMLVELSQALLTVVPTGSANMVSPTTSDSNDQDDGLDESIIFHSPGIKNKNPYHPEYFAVAPIEEPNDDDLISTIDGVLHMGNISQKSSLLRKKKKKKKKSGNPDSITKCYKRGPYNKKAGSKKTSSKQCRRSERHLDPRGFETPNCVLDVESFSSAGKNAARSRKGKGGFKSTSSLNFEEGYGYDELALNNSLMRIEVPSAPSKPPGEVVWI
jgi:hypothetical protein